MVLLNRKRRVKKANVHGLGTDTKFRSWASSVNILIDQSKGEGSSSVNHETESNPFSGFTIIDHEHKLLLTGSKDTNRARSMVTT